MPRGKHSGHKRGEEHYRWNDDQMLSSEGYIKVRVGRNHPLADPNGYAYEHLLVWISSGNPPPGPGELIHHKDENRQHNEIGNLELKKRGRHNAGHNAKRHKRPVLTEKHVATIRQRRSNGEELKSIAKDYGIAFQTVSKIARRERYAAAGRLLDGREWNEFPQTQDISKRRSP
jgi:hypothetical protein